MGGKREYGHDNVLGMTSSPAVFEPITLRGLQAKNRLWLSPMCQYSVPIGDGVPTDWHLSHYGSRAAGGFGLVMVESTAVMPEGRISPQDTGLWADHQIEPWQRIVEFGHNHAAMMGVQLGHAGRKASTYRGFPGEPSGELPMTSGGWVCSGPSAVSFPGLPAPVALGSVDIDRHVQAFVAAARRASSAGFDVVEIHAAHGYLLHQFLSPLSNKRTDNYGGSLENRCRFTREVVRAVRDVWPDEKPIFVRVSATDWAEGGWTTPETCQLASWLADDGADLIDVSSGGLVPADIPIGPGYQVDLAAEVKTAGVDVAAVGLITEPKQAEDIVASGKADALFIGRAGLREPSWPCRAAHELNYPFPPVTPAYHRAWK